MVVLTIFGLVLLIQFYFYLVIFSNFAWRRSVGSQKIGADGVSVVICAKNEALNLPGLFQSLSKQNHPNYELVFINDGSVDDTAVLMDEFCTQNKAKRFTCKTIHISSSESKGKKQALEKGIRIARYERILLTDADCTPVSSSWISSMSQPLSGNKQIVLGYGAYKKSTGSFLNKLIRFETLLTALQYFSYALYGRPYMGVGRNLCYDRSLFLEADGFSTHQHLRSGDDDLFVSQMAKNDNTVINDRADSFTLSKPSEDFGSWIRQKRRHITTATHYSLWHQGHLGLFFLSQIGFYLLMFYGVLFSEYSWHFIVLAFIRYFFWYAIVRKSGNKLDEKDLIALGPLYEFSLILVQLSIFLINLFSPPKHW